MSLPPEDLLERARQVVTLESSAVGSATESLDQNFVAVAERLLACTGKVLITGSGTSGTIAMRAGSFFGGWHPCVLSIAERRAPWRPRRPEKR